MVPFSDRLGVDIGEHPGPHAPPAEVSVLGAMLLDPSVIPTLATQLQPAHFFDRARGVLFETIVDLAASGTAVDVITVCDALREAGNLSLVGGPKVLADLLDAVPTAGNVQAHTDIVLRCHRQRQLADLGRQLAADACAGSDPAEASERFLDRLGEIQRSAQRRSRADFVTGESLTRGFEARVEFIADRFLHRVGVGVIYGRPGAGKGLWAAGVALQARRPFLWISADQARNLALASIAKVAVAHGVDAWSERLHFLDLRESGERLCDADVRERIHARAGKVRPALIVIDAATSASGVDLREESEVGPLLDWSAALAEQHSAAVLWIGHDRKSSESRQAGVDTLFGSRSWSSYADSVLYLTTTPDGIRRLRVQKCRAAPDGFHVDYRLEVGPGVGLIEDGDSRRPPSIEDAVMAFVARQPGCSQRMVRSGVHGHRKTDVDAAVQALLASRRLLDEGTGRGRELRIAPDHKGHTPGHTPDSHRDSPGGQDVSAGGHTPVGGAPGTRGRPAADAELEDILLGGVEV